MPFLASPMRRALCVLSASLSLLVNHAAVGDVILPPGTQRPPPSPLLEFGTAPSNAPIVEGLEVPSGLKAMIAVSRGRWTNACNIATGALSRQVPDIDALGVFALCAAVRNDREAASSALTRLHEVESVPYFALLTQGILLLRDRLPDKAEAIFTAVMQSHPGDPLGLYFSGEALHARHRDTEAISTFKAVLKSWPEHTPAMMAAARLMATPKASKEALNSALALTERAMSLDPSNLDAWRLLATLCDRTGQKERANAIALQWLSGPPRLK